MDLLLQSVQLTLPIRLELLVQQLLGALPIPHPEELVLMAGVAQLVPVHLAGEPFPAIEADLDLEGEPGLQADIHPAEGRVLVVVVQVQALARLAADGAAALAVGGPIEGPTRLDAAQDADQARLGTPFLGANSRAACSLSILLELR